MKIKILFYSICFILVSCGNKSPRKPLQHTGMNSLDETVYYNKLKLENENKRIQNFINADTVHSFIKSEKGFWYAYINKKEAGKKPIEDDIVIYEQEIISLDGIVLHSKEDFGLQQYAVDKELKMKGVQEGIKLMSEGEEILFVFSSFVAFGTLGDETKKIGINEPIICKIKLINIK